MFYDILDEKRKRILPFLSSFKDEFYLAGGTALALQIGHRDSIDFDFFSKNDLDTAELFEKIEKVFSEYEVFKIQEEKNTLTVLIDKDIKISFFTYKYELLKPLISEEYINLATIEDIACMKFSAIVSRSTEKDYVDLYFILQENKLENLLELSKEKFPNLSTALILKSLIYFDDLIEEEIIFKNNQNISLVEIKKFLLKVVKEIE